MTEFSVDPQSLANFANALSALGPVMEQMKSAGKQDKGRLGGSEIEGAVSSFADTWKYGAGQLEKHVKNLAHNVSTAATNYSTTENRVATAADRVH